MKEQIITNYAQGCKKGQQTVVSNEVEVQKVSVVSELRTFEEEAIKGEARVGIPSNDLMMPKYEIVS